MSHPTKFAKFWKNYCVEIVGGTSIVGVHWAWFRLQDNPDVVDQSTRKEFPLFRIAKYVKGRITGELSSDVDSTVEGSVAT